MWALSRQGPVPALSTLVFKTSWGEKGGRSDCTFGGRHTEAPTREQSRGGRNNMLGNGFCLEARVFVGMTRLAQR